MYTQTAKRSDKFAGCVAMTGRSDDARLSVAGGRQHAAPAGADRPTATQIHCRRRRTIKPNASTVGLTAFAQPSILRVPQPVYGAGRKVTTFASYFPFSVSASICIQSAAERANPRPSADYLFCVSVAPPRPRRRRRRHPGRRATGSRTRARPHHGRLPARTARLGADASKKSGKKRWNCRRGVIDGWRGRI